MQAGEPAQGEGQRGRSDALLEAGLLLASELSLSTVLRRLVELATEITDATYGAVGVVGDGGQISEFITVGLSDAQRQAIGHIPRGRGILGALIDDPRPLRLEHLQSDPRSVGFPAHHPPMESFLGAPVPAAGRVFGNIYLTNKRNGSFSPEDEASLVTLAAQAGAAIANAQAYAAVQHRERWLQALQETTTLLLERRSWRELLKSTLTSAAELVRANRGAVLSPDPENTGLLSVVAEVGEAPPARPRLSFDLVKRQSGLVLPASSDLARWLGGDRDLEQMLVVPISVQSSVRAAMLLGREAGSGRFSAGDRMLAESLAAKAGLALDYLDVQTELQRLAVVEERRRIARDIHDEPVQALIYLARRLEQIADDAPRDAPSAVLLDETRELAIAVADGLRQLTEGLRSETLEDRGLAAALEELANGFRERGGADARISLRGDLSRLPVDVERGLLRIAQEALSNVERHAHADRVWLNLVGDSRRVRLTVRDDGMGFDRTGYRAGRTGLGMIGMRERAALLGAKVRIYSRPGQGTTVMVVWARVESPSG